MTFGEHLSVASAVLMVVGFIFPVTAIFGVGVYLFSLQLQIGELRKQLEKTPKP